MALSREYSVKAMLDRHRTALAMAKEFICACCEGRFPTKRAAYVAAYEPRNEIMEQNVPKENIATYVVCEECSRLPEAQTHMRVEKYLVRQGLFKSDHKPLDEKGAHRGHGGNGGHGGHHHKRIIEP
jgi:hypothetical protein